jgi:copper(I)-binding protein
MTRWPAIAIGVVLAGVGIAGLVRGSIPQSLAGPSGGTGAAPIVVVGAYVRPPAPPTPYAAAYFTVYNTTGQDDRLISIATGAGATAVLHKVVGGVMTEISGGLVIPAHGSVVLSTGTGHVMIGGLFGPLRPGQTVNLDLTFQNAGQITVTAPVIALGAPAPTAPGASSPVTTRTATPTSTGATR